MKSYRLLLLILLLNVSFLPVNGLAEVWWETANLKETFDFRTVQMIVATPSGDLYAGSDEDYLLRSTDNGVTWTRTTSFPEQVRLQPASLLEASDGAVYVGTHTRSANYASIVVSRDGGQSWNTATDIVGIAFVPALLEANDGDLYASITFGGYPNYWSHVIRSGDGGSTWDTVETIPQLYQANSLHELATGAILLAGVCGNYPDTYSCVYSSPDDGQTWSLLGALSDSTGIEALLIATNGFWYAATTPAAMVYRSEDSGQTWSETGAMEGVEYVYDLEESVNNRILAATDRDYYSVFESTTNGTTWVRSGDLWESDYTSDLTKTPNGDIFAATSDDGRVFRYIDSCWHWMYQGIAPPNDFYTAFLVDNGGMLYASEQYASGPNIVFQKSSDGGQHWEGCGEINGMRYISKAMATSQGLLLAGGAYLYTSDDDCSSWTQVNNLYTGSIVRDIIETDDGTLFLSFSSSVYRSLDDAETWELMLTVEEMDWGIISSQLLASQDGSIYFTHGSSVWHSLDNGITWNVNDFVAAHEARDIMEDELGALYVTADPNRRVFKSNDQGTTWNHTDYLTKAFYLNQLFKDSDNTLYVTGWVDYPIENTRSVVFTSDTHGEHWYETCEPQEGPMAYLHLAQSGEGPVWSLNSDSGEVYSLCKGCLIDGDCILPDQSLPGDRCTFCDPGQTTSWWTTVEDGCIIDEACYPNGTINPANECEVCDTSQSTEQWTMNGNACDIAGICYQRDETNPEQGCLICDPDRSLVTWSNNDGAACDDVIFCNGTDTCQDGECTIHTGNPCQEGETCDESGDQCLPVGDDDDTGDDDTGDDDTGDDDTGDDDTGDDDTGDDDTGDDDTGDDDTGDDDTGDDDTSDDDTGDDDTSDDETSDDERCGG